MEKVHIMVLQVTNDRSKAAIMLNTNHQNLMLRAVRRNQKLVYLLSHDDTYHIIISTLF